MTHQPNIRRSLDTAVTKPDFHRTCRRFVRRIACVIRSDQGQDRCSVISAVNDVRCHDAATDVELMYAIPRHLPPPMSQGRGAHASLDRRFPGPGRTGNVPRCSPCAGQVNQFRHRDKTDRLNQGKPGVFPGPTQSGTGWFPEGTDFGEESKEHSSLAGSRAEP